MHTQTFLRDVRSLTTIAPVLYVPLYHLSALLTFIVLNDSGNKDHLIAMCVPYCEWGIFQEDM